MAHLWHRNPNRSTTAFESRFWNVLHADVTVTSSGYDSTNGWTASSVDGYGIKYPRGIQDQRGFSCGCRVNVASLPAVEKIILAMVNAAGEIQVAVTVNTDGTLQLWVGDMATLLATSIGTISTSTWYKLGFKGAIDGASGSLEAHLDGVPFVRVNNVNTAVESGAQWSGVYAGFSSDWTMGHLYVRDWSGGVTDLIPGAYVKTLAPDANGSSTDWIPVGASTSYQAIDESTPDDDASVLLAPHVLGARFTASMSALATTRVIHAAQLSTMVRNVADSGLSASHEIVAMISGSPYVDAWQSVTVDKWHVLTKTWETSPSTSVPWTVAEINAGTFGGQLRS